MRSISSRSSKPTLPSVLGWALVLSIALHLVFLPFFGLRAQAQGRPEHQDRTTITIDRHPKPTPPPPTPTPPPPKRTPPPVRVSVEPQATHPRLRPPKIAHRVATTGEPAYVPQSIVSDANVRPGVATTSAPNVAATGTAPVPVATTAPATPTPTPKPACANPNADAAVKGRAAEPDYPAAARDAGATGTSVVKVTLDASGAPVDVAVQRSSGFAALDRAALAAARASAYTPEVVDCVKTAGQYLFTVDFDGQ